MVLEFQCKKEDRAVSKETVMPFAVKEVQTGKEKTRSQTYPLGPKFPMFSL